MRKLMIWILAALIALSGFAFAEPAGATVSAALNGGDAVLVESDIYLAIPDGARQMLVRVPTAGGDPVCVDRGDRFEDLVPFAGGVVYLKTENNSSAIMSCNGDSVSTVYGFGASSASCLSYYGGRLLVLIDGLLHSIEPGTQLCLRLSGSAMLDYVLGNGNAYFLSAGDRMEYTAQLEGGGSVSTQAGCVYSLDLNSGETTLLLKSGGRDLKIYGDMLYFHNLADAYAVRTATSAQLLGKVHGLNVQQRSLTDECSEPDNGFWVFDRGLVVWYNGALNMETEAGNLSLYAPESGATVVSDGENLYAWEAGKRALTKIALNGTATAIYSGDLTQARDLSLAVTPSTPNPSASASATPEAEYSDADPNGNSGWFQSYMDNQGSSGSGSSGVWAKATPIGATATPAPTPVTLPDFGSDSGSGSGTTLNGSTGSSSSSSSGTTSSGGTYSVSISYLKVTGGSVNVRSGPGTGYSVKTSLSKGTVVKCTGKGSKDSGGNTWYQISHGGVTGWISAGYAKKTSAPDANYVGPEQSMKGSTVTITGDSVNVRAKPNLNGSDLGVVKKGAKLTFKGAKSVDSRGVAWYKVSYNGKTGWVSSRYSKVSGSGSSSSSSGSGSSSGTSEASGTLYTTGKINVRSGPGLSYSSKGTIASGTKFTVTARARDGRNVTWYKGSGGGKSGWVSSVYLSSSKPSSGGGSSSGGSGTGSKVVTTGSVTIRSKANKSSSKVGYIASGKTAKYLGKSSKDSRGVWWYKISYDGKTGWVSSKYAYIK